jgi:hypothetical protein
MDQGQKAAFAGALDRPPTSTWEIFNPREYEQKEHAPAVPLLPNIHPLDRQALSSPTTLARWDSSTCKFWRSFLAAMRRPAT